MKRYTITSFCSFGVRYHQVIDTSGRDRLTIRSRTKAVIRACMLQDAR